MKGFFSNTLVFLFLFSSNIKSVAEVRPVASKIKEVTVFLAGAQVHRSASTDLPAGRTELVFKNISPNLDKQSIQVKGDGEFTILSVTHQLNYLEEQQKREEIAVLESEKYRLSEQRKMQNGLLSVYQQEQDMLAKNQAIGGANTGVSTSELRQAVDFQRQRMTEVFQLKSETEKAILKIDSTISKINKQLAALNKEKETATSEIIVTVSAKAAVAAKFEIGYYVINAGWFATYDLRVKNVSSPVDLSFKANVFQQTGEDWDKVKLTLSNGNPTVSGFAQELRPWYLRYGSYQNRYAKAQQAMGGRGGITSISGRVTDENGEPLIGATVLVKGTSVGTVTDIDGSYSLHIPSEAATIIVSYTGFVAQQMGIVSGIQNIVLRERAEQLSEVVVTGRRNLLGAITSKKKKDKSRNDKTIAQQNEVVYQATTIDFEIESAYSIPSDGKTRMVDIKVENVPADYRYFTAPKIEEKAYLTAHIPDWQELNLLDGEVNLFFEGAFLGKSLLDTRKAGDTLDISLGVDKGIVVKRTKLKDFTSRRFLGSNKKETRGFEIIIKNNKREAIDITVQDQFPISTNKDIEVEDLKYKGAKRDKKTELLTWHFELPPKEERRLELSYSVKYPKRKVLGLE
ncbi:MAG TPA: mucoidy inhibitor MuiA family protein [Bacteroidetes bacterium]|nr:mucoidy inhibitor MuiA family protein [Bacteroidota bacterium]